jgi:fused signal recognition particle receptor
MSEKQEKKGWFSRLKEGLKKSSSKISEGITTILTKRKLDQETLDELEELLISSDLGVKTASQLIQELAKEKFNQDASPEEVKTFLATRIATLLLTVEKPLSIAETHKPHVLLIVGVNGSGKTTTIGKLAKYFQDQKYKVRIAACDTFRAAAVEQVKIWADRLSIPILTAPQGSDPASVAFESLQLAQKNQEDILIIDTAGRLHNKKDLMDELSKIKRVLQKVDTTAPHQTLLVLDATIGQNAHSQVDIFMKTIDVNGLVVTKLDGTARGGVLVGLSEKFALPVYAIGVGEGENDLRPFEAKSFAFALLGIEE